MEILQINVGGLLRKIAFNSPQAEVMVVFDKSGKCIGSRNYACLLYEAERLATKLVTRFASREKIVVRAPNV